MSRPPLLDRIAARAARVTAAAGAAGEAKAFTQPNFWSQPEWLSLGSPWSAPDQERIGNDFMGYIEGAYKSDGIVFACILARQSIFSQARFGWREFKNLRPGELFPSAELDLLERPWTNATTIDLLARMEPVASLAGNYYATKCDDNGNLGKAATGPGQRIVNMRPDWVTIVIASPTDNPYDLRAKIAGYLYEPNGSNGGRAPTADAVLLMPDEVCHWAPLPDPAMRFRGMSWLTPILREIQADKAATAHKDNFLANGAQLGVVVRFDKDTGPEAAAAFQEKFNATHRGTANAYKTLFLGGGADVTVIGADMQQLDLKALQGGGETRIAAASGIHPVIVGLSEGLQGSSLNTGNFGAARRLAADKTMQHLWGTASSSLQTLLTPPAPRAQLWFDTRDVPFLREDQKDAAEIQSKQAYTIRNLVDAGYDPATVVPAVEQQDWSLLKHSGLYSVQLQKPGNNAPDTPPPAEED